MTNQKTITKNMTFGEILEKNPKSAEILFNKGLYCIGCGMATSESFEEGCKAHGFSEKQINDLIKKLNDKK